MPSRCPEVGGDCSHWGFGSPFVSILSPSGLALWRTLCGFDGCNSLCLLVRQTIFFIHTDIRNSGLKGKRTRINRWLIYGLMQNRNDGVARALSEPTGGTRASWEAPWWRWPWAEIRKTDRSRVMAGKAWRGDIPAQRSSMPKPWR